MPFNIFKKAKSPIINSHPGNAQQDTSDDIRFIALKISIHGEIDYNIVQSSYRWTTHFQDHHHYFVPKPFEPSRPENRGVPFRMLVWELKDDVFAGSSSEWKGRYSVWYRSDLRGNFYLVKQRHADPARGATVYYDDIPVPRKAHYWFLSEINDIRRAILEKR